MALEIAAGNGTKVEYGCHVIAPESNASNIPEILRSMPHNEIDGGEDEFSTSSSKSSSSLSKSSPKSSPSSPAAAKSAAASIDCDQLSPKSTMTDVNVKNCTNAASLSMALSIGLSKPMTAQEWLLENSEKNPGCHDRLASAEFLQENSLQVMKAPPYGLSSEKTLAQQYMKHGIGLLAGAPQPQGQAGEDSILLRQALCVMAAEKDTAERLGQELATENGRLRAQLNIIETALEEARQRASKERENVIALCSQEMEELEGQLKAQQERTREKTRAWQACQRGLGRLQECVAEERKQDVAVVFPCDVELLVPAIERLCSTVEERIKVANGVKERQSREADLVKKMQSKETELIREIDLLRKDNQEMKHQATLSQKKFTDMTEELQRAQKTMSQLETERAALLLAAEEAAKPAQTCLDCMARLAANHAEAPLVQGQEQSEAMAGPSQGPEDILPEAQASQLGLSLAFEAAYNNPEERLDQSKDNTQNAAARHFSELLNQARSLTLTEHQRSLPITALAGLSTKQQHSPSVVMKGAKGVIGDAAQSGQGLACLLA